MLVKLQKHKFTLECQLYTLTLVLNTVEPLLSDPLLSEFSIIEPLTHSLNSI